MVRKTLRQFVVEYGTLFIIVYLAIFTVVWVSFWAAIKFGWSNDTTAANVGAWAAAYIATKLTQPLRIVASVAITPPLAKLWERVMKRPAPSSS